MKHEGRLRTKMERGRASVPAELRDKIESWWQLFMDRDPSWVDARAEWRKLDNSSVNMLVENLIILMVRAYDVGNGVMYKAAIGEIIEFKDRATPYLVTGLANDNGDDVIRTHCVQALSLIGKDAMPSIVDAYDDADRFGRRHLLRAAAKMAVPEATPFFQSVVDSESEFQPRITAIEGLGRSADPRGLPTLVTCLGDEDISVRKFAAGWLGNYGRQNGRPAVAGLIDCLGRAESAANAGNREGEVAANCQRSLRRITGRRWSNATQWREWSRQR